MRSLSHSLSCSLKNKLNCEIKSLAEPVPLFVHNIKRQLRSNLNKSFRSNVLFITLSAISTRQNLTGHWGPDLFPSHNVGNIFPSYKLHMFPSSESTVSFYVKKVSWQDDLKVLSYLCVQLHRIVSGVSGAVVTFVYSPNCCDFNYVAKFIK